MAVIRSFGVASTAKVMGTLYAGLGLIIGAMFTLVSLIGAAIGPLAGGSGSDAIFGLVFGLGAIVIMPIFYGGMGLVGGAIGAGLYNLVARFVGGVEVELG